MSLISCKQNQSDADKLDTPRLGEEHKIIINKSTNNPKIFFIGIDDLYTDAACGLYNAKVKQEFPETNASLSSSVCLGSLIQAKENQGVFTNAYRLESNPRGLNFRITSPIERECELNPNEKICIVNTGGK